MPSSQIIVNIVGIDPAHFSMSLTDWKKDHILTPHGVCRHRAFPSAPLYTLGRRRESDEVVITPARGATTEKLGSHMENWDGGGNEA